MTTQKIKINDKNVNLDPYGQITINLPNNSVYILKPGTKILYSAERGYYRVGYYLGVAPNGRDAICLLDHYNTAISRLSPSHLFIVDWSATQARHYDKLEQTYHNYLNDNNFII